MLDLLAGRGYWLNAAVFQGRVGSASNGLKLTVVPKTGTFNGSVKADNGKIHTIRGILKVVAVKAPGFGDRRKAILEDIAILTGGRVITEDLGIKLENVELADLGTAKRVVIDKDTTTVIGGRGDKKAIEGRTADLRRRRRAPLRACATAAQHSTWPRPPVNQVQPGPAWWRAATLCAPRCPPRTAATAATRWGSPPWPAARSSAWAS